MRKFIVIAMIALLAAGCSGGKKSEKNISRQTAAKPAAAKAQSVPAAPLTPVAPAVKTVPPSSLAVIEGEVNLERFKSAKGNLFIYIVDESKMPDEIVPLAASIYPEQTIKSQKMNFVMRNVPAGTWSIIAVWDIAPPYCQMTNLYCAASVKDGLGESSPVTSKPGQTTSGVIIDIY